MGELAMFENFISIFVRSILFILHISNQNEFPEALTREQEDKYLDLMINHNDKKAREKLIEHNLRLVAHIIKKYYSTGYDQDDLISIGTIGLIKAINSYSLDRNVRLATYAARCIDNEVLMYFRSMKKCSQDVYMSDPIDIDKEGNALTLIDIISDDIDIVEDIDLKIKSAKLKNFINKVLDERERTIIELRYGLNGKAELTQREIAKKLKISRSYVSRIEKRAITLLYNEFTKAK